MHTWCRRVLDTMGAGLKFWRAETGGNLFQVSGTWESLNKHGLGKRIRADCRVWEAWALLRGRGSAGGSPALWREEKRPLEEKLGSRTVCIWICPATAHEARIHAPTRREYGAVQTVPFHRAFRQKAVPPPHPSCSYGLAGDLLLLTGTTVTASPLGRWSL